MGGNPREKPWVSEAVSNELTSERTRIGRRWPQPAIYFRSALGAAPERDSALKKNAASGDMQV